MQGREPSIFRVVRFHVFYILGEVVLLELPGTLRAIVRVTGVVVEIVLLVLDLGLAHQAGEGQVASATGAVHDSVPIEGGGVISTEITKWTLKEELGISWARLSILR